MLSGDTLPHNNNRAGLYYPPAILVAGVSETPRFYTARILSTRLAHRDAWMATQGVGRPVKMRTFVNIVYQFERRYCLLCATCITTAAKVVQERHRGRAATVTQEQNFPGLGDHWASKAPYTQDCNLFATFERPENLPGRSVVA